MNIVQGLIGALLIVVVFSILYGSTYSMYTYTSVTNETFELNDTLTYVLAHYPVVSGSYTLYNDTGQVTELTDETHYNITTLANGTVWGVIGIQTSGAGDRHNVSMDYQYVPAEYLTNSQTRAMFQYGILMAGVVIFVFLAMMTRQ